MGQQALRDPGAAFDQTTMALERTFLAYERTLMAWTRTSTSLITFGFTLYKFFEYFHENGDGTRGGRSVAAREFGLIMIGIGVGTLSLAAWQHRLHLRRLRVYYPGAPFSLAFLLAVLISCLGILGFIAGLFRS